MLGPGQVIAVSDTGWFACSVFESPWFETNLTPETVAQHEFWTLIEVIFKHTYVETKRDFVKIQKKTCNSSLFNQSHSSKTFMVLQFFLIEQNEYSSV